MWMQMTKWFLLHLLTCCIAAGPSLATDTSARHAAIQWATANRVEVFNQLFPPADAYKVQMPTCRVTTIRSPGSIDSFEFEITIKEDCQAVDPHTGLLQTGKVGAVLAIPEGDPISVQLAVLRLKDPALSMQAARTQIRIISVPLNTGTAQDLVQRIATTPVPLLPPTEISLDARSYEVMSNTGIEKRFASLVGATSRTKNERDLVDGISQLLASVGYTRDKLRYDPAAWNN
jgi:hypothetical protein